MLNTSAMEFNQKINLRDIPGINFSLLTRTKEL